MSGPDRLPGSGSSSTTSSSALDQRDAYELNFVLSGGSSEPPTQQSFDASYARINSSGGDNFSRNVGKVQVTGSGNIVNINSERTTEPPRMPAPRCPPPSQNFVGRVQEQKRMDKFFFGDGVLFDQLRVFLLIGMGGCGKTQLARKFMARVYRRIKDRTHLVFYIDATTVQTLTASLATIAKSNGVGESSEAALGWMSNLDKEIFLYYDNADDPAVNLRDYFPNTDNARILITTRLQDAQRHYGSGRDSAIHLGALSEDEAMDLLLRTAALDSDISQEQAITSLIQELHCLPLAVVQAGAAIFKSKWTFQEYLDQFRRLHTSLMDGKKDRVPSQAIDDYPMHVYTTWKLSYDKLPESTAQLLRLCAHLHHTGITEDLFRVAFSGLEYVELRGALVPFGEEESSARAFLASFATDGVWDDVKFRWCIQDACSHSLMSYDTDSKTYSIHPLIHSCLQSVASPPSQTAFLLAASMAPSLKDQPRLASLAPHAQRVLRSVGSETGCLHPIPAWFFAECFSQARMHSASRTMYEVALQGLTEHLPADHDTVLTMQHDLAFAMHHTGDYDGAEKLLRKVLASTQASPMLGHDHPKTINALWNLASILHALGRYPEAETVLRDALSKKRANLGENHPESILALVTLASTIRSLGRYEEAEELEREALEKNRAVFGVDHPHTVESLANLAATLHSLGRYEEAVGMKREVWEKRRASLGANHPDSILALANLASTLHSLGRFEEAEGMMRETLERSSGVLGEDHPDTVQALENLAATLHSLGQYHEAEPMKRTALEKRRAMLGPGHAETILALANLAATLHALGPGRYREAEAMERKVLESRRAVFGSDHAETYRALTNLAVTVYKQGRYAEAEPMLRESVQGFMRVSGAGHENTGWAKDRLRTCVAGKLELETKLCTAMHRDGLAEEVRQEDGVSSSPASGYMSSDSTSIPTHIDVDDTSSQRPCTSPGFSPLGLPPTSADPSTVPQSSVFVSAFGEPAAIRRPGLVPTHNQVGLGVQRPTRVPLLVELSLGNSQLGSVHWPERAPERNSSQPTGNHLRMDVDID